VLNAPRALWHRLTGANRRPRVLFVEDFVPDPRIGAGAPRALAFMRAIIAAGASLTLLPTMVPHGRRAAWRLLPEARAVQGYGLDGIGRFLSRYGANFDLIIVSRPHNMAAVRAASAPGLPPVIYDAEALFAARGAQQRALSGAPMSADDEARSIAEEVALAEGARMVLAVDHGTAGTFRAAGHADVRVLGHAAEPRPTPSRFEERSGFLFVGPTYSNESPNTDTVAWFVDEVLPAVRQAVDAPFRLAGRTRAPAIAQRAAAIEILGEMNDLAAAYGRARVFVAPSRIAAGLPIKVYDAAAHGVPAVVTPLLAEQLGWHHEREVLVGATAEDFAAQCVRLHSDPVLWQRIRDRALARVTQDCAPQAFNQVVARMLVDAVGAPAR
jgi:hypothetical protein